MEYSYDNQVKKVKFNIPVDSKEQVIALKEELEKWEQGVSLALGDKEYIALSKELDSINDEIIKQIY